MTEIFFGTVTLAAALRLAVPLALSYSRRLLWRQGWDFQHCPGELYAVCGFFCSFWNILCG